MPKPSWKVDARILCSWRPWYRTEASRYLVSCQESWVLSNMLTPRADSSCPVLTKDQVMTALRVFEDAVLQVHPFVDLGIPDLCSIRRESETRCLPLSSSWPLTQRIDGNFGCSVTQIWLRAKVVQLCTKAEGSDSISVMRCLTAIALHSFYENHISAASCLISLALSKATTLGFHRCTPERRTPLSVEHSAARIFSTLFVLERWATFGTMPRADRILTPQKIHQLGHRLADWAWHPQCSARSK